MHVKKRFILIVIITLFLFIGSSFAIDVTVLKSRQYIRNSGKPDVYTDTFPGRVGTGTIFVLNGDSTGNNRVSSAIVTINGQQIFSTNEFNQKIYNLERTINLQDSNDISVKLASTPGSYLTIEIKQEIPADGAGVVGRVAGVEILSLVPHHCHSKLKH